MVTEVCHNVVYLEYLNICFLFAIKIIKFKLKIKKTRKFKMYPF